MLRCCRYLLLLLLLVQVFLSGKQSLAQSRAALFFRATGHHLSDTYAFLSFWEARGGEPILGLPITEPFEQDGAIVQYLERARLEYHPRLGLVLLGRLGAERTRWRTFPAAPSARPNSRSIFFAETGHTLAPPFRAFWEEHGGLEVFGYPISEPLWESAGGGFYRVQYFERVRLEYHPAYSDEKQRIQVSRLGLELALALDLDLTPVAPQPGAIVVGEERPAAKRGISPGSAATSGLQPGAQPIAQAPALSASPSPVAESQTPTPSAGQQAPASRSAGTKRIEVSLSRQWLYAYEDDRLVFDAPVATGKDGFNTPTGTFAIYYKIPLQTMRGNLNGESWEVPNVPHAMYFNGSVALHGTYWHNLFGTGTRVSHGCVNLGLDDAAWLYEWAPIGTLVTVYY